MPAGSLSGSDGCDTTGASIEGSSIIVSAKLPVKHIPIAPTPGPPHASCASFASARSHRVTGLDPAPAKARNSALVAVMRRDGAKAADYAKRHNVARWYDDGAKLIADAEGLRDLLHDGASRLARLPTGLKQHRRQSRAVRTAMQSLRLLKLDG